MSSLTIGRIAGILEKQFDGLVDMSDFASRPAQVKDALHSRAVAALCIKSLALTDAATAAASITDGFHDGGLDAIHFDQATDTLFLVTSRWGGSTIDSAAAGSFVKGAEDLLSAKFERFNDKVRAKEATIREALGSERDVRVVLVAAQAAAQPVAAQAKQKIDDFVEALNDPVPIARAEYFNQEGLYRLITSELDPAKIALSITLRNWGAIKGPYLAYYGHVDAAEVATWWNSHGKSLCARNLRHFFHASDVNEALGETLRNEPQHFWYFNNGITIICDSATKKLKNATKQDVGEFACEGVSVVNGAQTVGTIGTTPQKAQNVESWIQVRIIPLDQCPAGFDARITRANNFQNAVTRRDLAALDPEQHRLATEFALDRRRYVYKSGETDPRGDAGCSIMEATPALACAHSASLAVQAKREIGELWANTEGPPYTELFNARLTGTAVWRAVVVMRAVDDELQQLRKSDIPRGDLVAVHLNRVILHLVFADPQVKKLRGAGNSDDALEQEAGVAARRIFPRVSEYLEKHHESDYLAPLSKNRSKCEALVRHLVRAQAPAPDPATIDNTLRALTQVSKSEVGSAAGKEPRGRKKKT